ncbi:MAG: nucleoside phosphorylase [Winogradskyella sp.]|uniref:nucleoside phosphorylase n=1 Tax=Winogradskyella sp. TaxID=1883156 RepID=UPI0025EB1AB5|nr:nucleoside phosphorylase [Winogradskyella sp.]NRB60954.1 nucleoside phosphorylase [Winogradskyella sp.]
MSIKNSELILNPDGSVYHLNLKPENISDTIIFVGDQDRVEKITKHFDSIEFSTQKREFKTQTGYYKDRRISVISTGIGPDNIDIVLNELDALVNIDLNTRIPKSTLTHLNIIRIGTSGSLQADIPVDSFLISTHGLDVNGMLHFYQIKDICNPEIEDAFIKHTNWDTNKARPLIIDNSKYLQKYFESDTVYTGMTGTAGGFYGPQGRVLRLPLHDANLNSKLDSFKHKDFRITNFEMETSVIYGLSKLLGHEALSLNAIIANRATGNFSKDPKKAVEKLIVYALERIVNI